MKGRLTPEQQRLVDALVENLAVGEHQGNWVALIRVALGL